MSRGKLEEVIEFSHTVGMKYPIVPGLPEEMRTSRPALQDAAKKLNEIARTLKSEGLRTGYHNHAWEFSSVEGELPCDIIFGNTVTDVIMQIDIGHALRGGADPALYLKRYAGRAVTVHLKDFSSQNENALIGEGEMDWQEVFALCESIGGTEWYIVEQETGLYSPFECAERSLTNLHAMGK
jgi:sugar phosphate isomerase/epimerase